MLILRRKIVRCLPWSLRKKLPKRIVIIRISRGESQRLNRMYLGRRRPANVLSFRYGPLYGEILISPEIIRREAKKQGNTYKHQMTRMILHGMLHLAGIHHEKSYVIAKKVERIEDRVLRRIAAK